MNAYTKSKPSLQVQMKSESDGLGLIYGIGVFADTVIRIDVLPPVGAHTRPDAQRLLPPDPVRWVVYVDGVEIARVAELEFASIAVFRHMRDRGRT